MFSKDAFGKWLIKLAVPAEDAVEQTETEVERVLMQHISHARCFERDGRKTESSTVTVFDSLETGNIVCSMGGGGGVTNVTK